MKKLNKITLTLLAVQIFLIPGVFGQTSSVRNVEFNIGKDLLLVQLDCKTDVDDLHTAAGLVTLLSAPEYSDVKFHAVAGTYGVQEGLYVPPEKLMRLAFSKNWSDAHKNPGKALNKVANKVKKVLENGGDIWIAEAGQSDFSASLVKAIHHDLPEYDLKERWHIVQHSDWNEEVTSPESLEYVKENIDYHKIPDGNTVGNGTPGFRTPNYEAWKYKITDTHLLKVWQLAVDLGNQYNGADGRYNNEAIAERGIDFSDLSEVCWILGLQDINDTEEFFDRFGTH